MKKITFGLAACALLPFMAAAQPLSHRTALEVFNELNAGLGGRGSSNTAARTTGTACRLVAMTNYDCSSGALWDSSAYVYSGTRGSYLNLLTGNITQSPDMAILYAYNATTAAYDSASISLTTYNSGNQPIGSTSKEWNAALASWWHFKKDTNVYDAAGLRTNYHKYDCPSYSTAWLEEESRAFTYTSANLLAEETVLQGPPAGSGTTTMSNYERMSYTYDAAGRKTSQTKEKPFGTSWVFDERTTYEYDAAGRVSRWVMERYVASAHLWDSQTIVTRVYDALNNPIEEMNTIRYAGTGAWGIVNRRLFNMFVGGQPQEIVFQNWGAAAGIWGNSRRYNITYNSFAQPTLLTYQEWDGSGVAWTTPPSSRGTRFYYETHISAGVQDKTPTNGVLSVYPVPASEAATMHVCWDEPQAFTVTILDMQGRTVSTWPVAQCSEYTERVNMDNMPAGNYVVKMEGRNGSAVQQISVVR